MRLASPGIVVIFSESGARGASLERLVAAAGLAESTIVVATTDACVAVCRVRLVSWLIVDLEVGAERGDEAALQVLNTVLAERVDPSPPSPRAQVVVVVPALHEGLARALAAREVDEFAVYDGASEGEVEARLGLAASRRDRDAARKATSLAGRDRFIRVAAHDLRNPLNVMSVAASTLRRGVPADRAAMYLDKMARASEKMNRLIEDLLDATRLDAGHVVLVRDQHAAPSVVEEVLARIEPAARDRGVTLAVAVAQVPAELRLHVDREQVTKAIVHVVRHAVMVAPPGSHLVLSVTGDQTEVHFEVLGLRADLAAEQRALAFEPYAAQPASSHTGSRPSSNELGLAIARGFVVAHGGRLGAGSRPDGTVALTLSLPSFDEAEATQA